MPTGKNIQAEIVSRGRDYIAWIFVLTNSINPRPTVGGFRCHGNAAAHLACTFPHNLSEVACSRAKPWLAKVVVFNFIVPHFHKLSGVG